MRLYQDSPTKTVPSPRHRALLPEPRLLCRAHPHAAAGPAPAAGCTPLPHRAWPVTHRAQTTGPPLQADTDRGREAGQGPMPRTASNRLSKTPPAALAHATGTVLRTGGPFPPAKLSCTATKAATGIPWPKIPECAKESKGL